MKRNIVKNLSLREISGVTVPAQSHALMAIMKADQIPMVETIVKSLSTLEGAQSFNAFMNDESEQCAKWKAQEALWPVLDALRSSINSIAADLTLDDVAKQEAYRESVSQFVLALPSASQSSEMDDTDDLLKIFTKSEDDMSDELKKAAELTAQLAEMTKKLGEAETLAKMSDAEKKHLASLDATAAEKFKKATAEERGETMKKVAASEEVFKTVTGAEIRKSAVGDVMFDILKAQDAEIAKSHAEITKANDRARTVELTKKADEELGNLPGETLAKVAMLKAVDAMPDAARDTLNAILKAANEAASGAFVERGSTGGSAEEMAKSGKRETLVKAYRAANPTATLAAAEVAVIEANPELYEG